MKDQQQPKGAMAIVDVKKLYAQHAAGISIRQLSLLYHLPYASLHRALKKVEAELRKKEREPT